MQAQVMKETWFAMADSIIDGGKDPSDGKRRTRPFITFVPNDDGQLEQLSFDPCQFSRNSAAEVFIYVSFLCHIIIKRSASFQYSIKYI